MKYFTISELIHSDTAVARKLWNGANREQEDNLTALVDHLLDPLRLFYGRPINISSGFRSPALNRAVGGVANSQHLRGEAADIDTGSRTENQRLARLIIQRGLPFDQLIDEANYAWLHVSYKRTGPNRRQCLRMRGGKYLLITPDDL